MIAKVSTGRSFGGTIRYLYEGHKEEVTDKRAELLDYNGIRPTKDEMIKDFNRHRWLNPDLGNAVGHISVSYHPQDSHKATNPVMIEHARLLMQKMKIDPDQTQWALIRHSDREHEHFHLVYNRVDYNGRTISDAYNYKRSHEATRAIAQQYGLTIAAEKKKDLPRTTIERLPGHDQARYKIFQLLTKVVSQATTIDHLKKALAQEGIETKIQKNGQGMSFKTGQHAFKASEVDRDYTGGKIHAQIEQNRQYQLQQQHRQERRNTRTQQIRHNHHTLHTHKQARTTTSQQQAIQANQRATTRQQAQQNEFMKGFAQLADIIKQRDQQKAFGQLAEIIKQRDQQRQQEQTKQQEQKQQQIKQQNPKRDPSKGLGF
jgi:hypothetical protein